MGHRIASAGGGTTAPGPSVTAASMRAPAQGLDVRLRIRSTAGGLNQAHRRRELSALFASDRISLFPCPGSVIVNKLPGMQSPISIPGLPVALSWQVPPVSGRIDGGVLTVAAGERTDMFIDPAGGEPVLTAPRLLGPAPAGDFQLAARVRATLAHTYDAGVLLVWSGERTWAKLCFELSPQGAPTVVTVVTRGESDDANAFTVDGDAVWLRVSRLGQAWAFHASHDGAFWHLVRYFRLGDPSAPALVGFEAQSPTGPGCEVTFDQVTFVPAAPAGLRDGS